MGANGLVATAPQSLLLRQRRLSETHPKNRQSTDRSEGWLAAEATEGDEARGGFPSRSFLQEDGNPSHNNNNKRRSCIAWLHQKKMNMLRRELRPSTEHVLFELSRHQEQQQRQRNDESQEKAVLHRGQIFKELRRNGVSERTAERRQLLYSRLVEVFADFA